MTPTSALASEHKKENTLPSPLPLSPSPLSLLQKTLLVMLYALVLLMIIFSLLAVRQMGEEGYGHCVAQKCAAKGEAYCTKAREIINCCLGAGGETQQTEQGLGCTFP